MSTISEIRELVKDYLQVSFPGVSTSPLLTSGVPATVESRIDALCLQAMNNARKWAERRATFSDSVVTVRAVLPPGGWRSLDYLQETVERPATVAFGTVTASLVLAGGKWLVEIPTDDLGTGQPDELLVATCADAALVGKTLYVNRRYVSGANTVFELAYDSGLAQPATTPLATTFTQFNSAAVHRARAVRDMWVTGDDTLYPINFTTKHRQSHELIELQNTGITERYRPDPTVLDDEFVENLIIFNGRRFFLDIPGDTLLELELDISRWLPDYTEADKNTPDFDFFLTHGADYLMWSSIVEVNHLVQTFVPRQEGTPAPPVKFRDEAFMSIMIDAAYEIDGGRYHDLS